LEQPLRPWLLRVAANLVLQHRRKKRALPVGGSEAVAAILDERLESGGALEGPVFAAMEHCLGQLGEGARQLVEWRYAEGLDICEVQARAGGKHSTVTMKLHRLRALLLECIRGQLKEATP
jgi:RNA polymerase sigma-70 factor (ECF subfamily)